MASKALAIPLLLAVNLLFFPMVSSSASPCPPSSSSKLKPTPSSSSSPFSPSSSKGRCPIDALKLGVCANVLNLVNVKVGAPPTLPSCNLLKGLIDLEAAACLCTALKANVLGIKLNIPVSLSVILNNCGMTNSNFQCPMFLASTSKFQFP